jgi:hypothetical protein
MFAPPICRRRWRNSAFPFRQLRRRRRQPSEHRSERSEQSNTARCASSSELGRECGDGDRTLDRVLDNGAAARRTSHRSCPGSTRRRGTGTHHLFRHQSRHRDAGARGPHPFGGRPIYARAVSGRELARPGQIRILVSRGRGAGSGSPEGRSGVLPTPTSRSLRGSGERADPSAR